MLMTLSQSRVKTEESREAVEPSCRWSGLSKSET